MKVFARLMIAAIFLPTLCRADEGDDTLNFFLSKSDLVVAGTIVSQIMGVQVEMGVVNYPCDVKISEVIAGDAFALKDETIRANIIRFEQNVDDRHPLIRKDARCILFLKKSTGNNPPWKTADMWFGIQPANSHMIKSLAALSKPKSVSKNKQNTPYPYPYGSPFEPGHEPKLTHTARAYWSTLNGMSTVIRVKAQGERPIQTAVTRIEDGKPKAIDGQISANCDRTFRFAADGEKETSNIPTRFGSGQGEVEVRVFGFQEADFGAPPTIAAEYFLNGKKIGATSIESAQSRR